MHKNPPIPDQKAIIDALPENHPARDAKTRRDMLERARKATKDAYAPDSNFHVGAAIQVKSGEIYTGSNIESGGYEGLICAERNAVFDAVSHGEAMENPFMLDIVAVTCADLQPPVEIHDGSPCGACRQVVREFSDENTVVIVDDHKDGVLFRIADLLPHGFRFGPDFNKNAAAPDVADLKALEKKAEAASSPEELLDVARKIAKNAYAPMSGRRTGAVVVTKDGKAYAGVKVENSSTGLSANADRVAIDRAAMKGAATDGRDFIAKIAVAEIDDAGDRGGLSRLVNADLMTEFGNATTEIAVADTKNSATFTRADMFAHLGDGPAPGRQTGK